MIRRGKAEGWLHMPTEALLPWATLNEVSFRGTVPARIENRGGALIAKESLNTDTDSPSILLTVPRDLILSLERVEQHAKVDKDFREVLETLGDFGRTPRGGILSFLLAQASVSCPQLSARTGVHSPFSDYIKSLPLEPLPTFWTLDELQLLVGTSLAPAMAAKLKSLQREYELLCSSAENTRWYQVVHNHIEFDDWLQADAMYRSRALDFPEIGHCMVPCIDLANHAAGKATVAIYEKDLNGDAILLLRDGKQVQPEEEVTITYGDDKGACEMIFSYGFLEEQMDSAKALFLSLSIPDDDRFRLGKARIADCPPGFKILETESGEVEWEGEFIWLMCANEDDGLRFELARTVDGVGEEMQALFGEHELVNGATQLHGLLTQSDLWDVYQLRAVTILQQRVFDQLKVLYGTQGDVEATAHGEHSDIRTGRYNLIMKLRQLEFDLLEKAYETLETKKLALVESPVVIRYLATMNETATSGDEDFS